MLIEIGMAVLGVVVLIVSYKLGTRLNQARQVRNARNGKYGDEVRWAAELIQEGDDFFEMAVTHLPQQELMEIGIIAESKEEMRERTVERFEELTDDGIPEDFA